MRTLLCIIMLYASVLQAQDYEILFTSQTNNNDNIYSINHDGKIRQITDHPRKDSSPLMSPDGKSMVFTSERVGWWKIWMMDIDSQKVQQLTNSGSAEYAPTWSPDGKNIAFVSGRSGGSHIYTMTRYGKDIRQLTKEGSNAMPYWAADGSIYFSRKESGTYQIFRMDSDGANQRQLTQGNGDKLMPQLSPDKAKILYYGNQDGNMEVYVMDIKTKDTSRMTNHPLMDIRARWSPDGTRITFERGNKRNNQQIFIMDSNGSNKIQLTKSGYNYAPSFAY